MPNSEDEDMQMLGAMGASNDAISERLRKKKKPTPTPTPAPESDQSWWQRMFGSKGN